MRTFCTYNNFCFVPGVYFWPLANDQAQRDGTALCGDKSVGMVVRPLKASAQCCCLDCDPLHLQWSGVVTCFNVICPPPPLFGRGTVATKHIPSPTVSVWQCE